MYEQAEDMHRQTLKLGEQVLGREHPEALTSMNNLAIVLSEQGKYEQAEEVRRRSAMALRVLALDNDECCYTRRLSCGRTTNCHEQNS
jgi:hypothetical protein